jgi:hypothetical protein
MQFRSMDCVHTKKCIPEKEEAEIEREDLYREQNELGRQTTNTSNIIEGVITCVQK